MTVRCGVSTTAHRGALPANRLPRRGQTYGTIVGHHPSNGRGPLEFATDLTRPAPAVSAVSATGLANAPRD
jgi:hypothetical protein